MCALPALRLTQPHAAPEVVSASLANDVSGRLTPFNGPKVQPSRMLQPGVCHVPHCLLALHDYCGICTLDAKKHMHTLGAVDQRSAPFAAILTSKAGTVLTQHVILEKYMRLIPGISLQADIRAVGQILSQVLLTADAHATTQVKQTSTLPSALQRLLTEMVAEEPAERPDACQALQQCCKLLQC